MPLRQEPDAPRTRLPLPWRLAQLVRTLPEFRGRDRILTTLLTAGPRVDACVAGSFGGGLRFEGNPAVDANVLELVLLRFARPALAPVLDAALAPGSVFADVGANLGLYTLWGARRVGAQGRVHAFEPVPSVRACLARSVALNGFDNVRIAAAGVGAEAGRTVLYQLPGASGVTSRYRDGKQHGVEVDVTTLDAEFADAAAPPELVKVDVEGMEVEVLRGASRLLCGRTPPLLVLEANVPCFAASGTTYPELRSLLREAGGYQVWALTPGGLRLEPLEATTPGSLNVLAARRDLPAHARVLDRLARVRFARNMNA
jgi:FkbM family methyltransferase